ncbi:response regulator [Desulfocurvus sp. DL9XJH121]
MDHYEEIHTLRALVVDDDPVISEALAMALEDEGFEVAMFMRGQDALDAPSDGGPDLAFIDVVMPGMNGLDLAEQLKAKWPRMETVMISGSPSSGNIIRAMQIGAYDFLVKPFQPGDLRLCLSRFMDRIALVERAEHARHRYKTLIQNIPLLIFRLREDFSLDFVNRACASMLGYTPEEATSQHNWLLSRVRMRDRARVKKVLSSAFSSAFPLTVQCRLVHRKGFDLHGILKTLPSAERSRDRNLLDGIFVDISQRVYEEQARVQDEKLKTIGAISEEMAHEIRNPLMSIGGFARRLSAKAPDFPETEIILRESKRLEKLLQRIRGYLDPVAVERRTVSLETVLVAQMEASADELAREGVSLDAACDPGLPEALADPTLLGRTFGILLGDSLRVLDRGGVLRVRLFATDETVNASFDYELAQLKDIDPERIYLPYEDGGFGLPNCYRLVKQMGGVLNMTREDGRAVFTVCLPKACAQV